MEKERKVISVPIEKYTFTELSSDLARVRINVYHNSYNPNGSFFEDSCFTNSSESFKNKPICASYIYDNEGNIEDFQEHNDDEKPIGVVPETNNYSIEVIDNLTWACTDGLVFKEYCPKAYELLKQGKKISMEIEVIDGFKGQDKFYHIKQFNLLCITALGDNYEPAMGEDATITLFSKSNSDSFIAKFTEIIDKTNKLYKKGGKSMENDNLENKEEFKAIPFKHYPLADEGMAWDGSKQVKDADVNTLKLICAWYDTSNPDVESSYKLPHHLASDGHDTVWKGVSTAMGVLLGSMGGVDIPEADKKGVYNHLKKHYDEFKKEVPEFKSYTKEEFAKFEKEDFSMSQNQINSSLSDALCEQQCIMQGGDGSSYECNKYYLIDTIPSENVAIVIDCECCEYYGIPYTITGDIATLDYTNMKQYVVGDWRPFDDGGTNQNDNMDNMMEQFIKKVFGCKQKNSEDNMDDMPEGCKGDCSNCDEEMKKQCSSKKKMSSDVEIERKKCSSLQNELDKVKGEFVTLKTNYTELESTINSLTEENKDLKQFKADKELEFKNTQYEEILDRYSELKEVEGYSEIVKEKTNYTLEELEVKLKVFAFDNNISINKKQKFNKQVEKPVDLTIEKKINSEDYGAWACALEYLPKK